MYILSLVKIHWRLLKLSSRNENMGMSRAENLTKFAHQQSQTRSPQYQCTNQIWWKSTDVTHPETKYGQTDGRMTDKWMNGRTDTRTSNMKPYLATIMWQGIKTISSLLNPFLTFHETRATLFHKWNGYTFKGSKSDLKIFTSHLTWGLARSYS